MKSILCALAMGLFSTVADWVWARFLTDGAVLPGLLHGLLAFVLFALLLGGGRRLFATVSVAGLGLAAAFYPLYFVIGYLPALLVTWVGMWVALAALMRWAFDDGETIWVVLLRGGAAALGSALAFWSVAELWTDAAAVTSWIERFLKWSYAFLPGFLALQLGKRPAGQSRPLGTQ